MSASIGSTHARLRKGTESEGENRRAGSPRQNSQDFSPHDPFDHSVEHHHVRHFLTPVQSGRPATMQAATNAGTNMLHRIPGQAPIFRSRRHRSKTNITAELSSQNIARINHHDNGTCEGIINSSSAAAPRIPTSRAPIFARWRLTISMIMFSVSHGRASCNGRCDQRSACASNSIGHANSGARSRAGF